MSGRTIELSQLRYFVAVAEELSFRRAARRLNMTQPPLSRHIAMLEHLLETPLFDRTSRSVRLTPAGKRLLADATDILTRAESALLAARQAARGTSGSVEIGFVPSAAVSVIPRLTRRIRTLMPDVHLTLREVMTVEGIEALATGSLDFGILRVHAEARALPIHKLFSEGFVLALPRDHSLASQDQITPQDLHGQEFIGYSTERGGFLAEIIQGFLRARGVTPNEVFAVAQQHTMLMLVNEGFGVALVPASSRQLCPANVVLRDIGIDPNELHSDLYLLRRPKEPEPLIAALAAIIRDEFAGEALPRQPIDHGSAA